MKLLSVFAGLICSSLASPVAVEKHVESRDITVTPSELENLKLFANFTAAAYCPNNQDPLSTPGTPITCNGTICALVEENSVTSVLEFGGNDTETTASLKGFVSLSATQKAIVLSFAGSGQTIRTWLTNFNFGQTTYTLEDGESGCEGCTVHSGFQTAWEERRGIILPALTSAMATYPDYELVITGHSIGGAVATLAALELLAQSPALPLSLYTYGSPRIGNTAFATFATSTLGGADVESYRVTHKNDPIPQIPPTWIGYEHLAPEYWLPDESGETVVVCEGIGNSSCNAGTGLVPLEGASHNWYFGGIDACVGGLEW